MSATKRKKHDMRERRILDAASDLIVRYGYDKTTVSEIANAAGISKGAIYLHFDSKEALFEALLLREITLYSQRWLLRLKADPQGGTIGGLYKNSLYALQESPFMSAMFTGDKHILGSYVRKPDTLLRRQQQASARLVLVEMMQSVGAMRDDIDAAVIAHIMDMLAYGLVSMGDVMDAEQIPPIDHLIEGIAEMMQRALAPLDMPADPQAAQMVIERLETMITAYLDAD